MTIQELYSGLSSIGYPVAYRRFAEGDVPDPPYITYYYPGTDNFSADGIVYCPINEIDVELYDVKKNTEAEQKIEDFLTENEIFYEKQEYDIESEKMIQVIYEFEI